MFIAYLVESPERAKVVGCHLGSNSLDQERYPVLEVAEIPEPASQMEQIPVLYVNPVTKELWYEYIDKIPSTGELLARIADLELAIAALLGQ